MKKLFINFFFFFFLSFLFSCTALSQELPPGFGEKIKPGMDEPRKVRCPACAPFTHQYNQTLDQLLESEDILDEMDDEIAKIERNLNTLDAEIRDLKMKILKDPSPANSQRLSAVEAQKSTVSRQYVRYLNAYDKEERRYNALDAQMAKIAKALDDCEAAFCKNPAANTKAHVALAWYYFYLMNTDLGLFLGNNTSSRTGYIYTPNESFSGSHSQNNFILGPQAKFLFGAPDYVRFFILFNALSMFNASNTLLHVKTDFLSEHNSRVQIVNNWIARLLFGVESQPFLNRFTASAGLGVAAVNQNLKASIGEVNETRESNTITTYGPSAMIGLNYILCPTCVGGHPLILSGQVAADKYQGVNSSVTTSLNNAYQVKVNPAWQYSETIGLSIRF